MISERNVAPNNNPCSISAKAKTVSAESGLKEKLRRMTSGTNVVVCMCVRAASSTAGGCHVYSTHDRSLPTRQYWSMNDESCSYPAIYVYRAIWYSASARYALEEERRKTRSRGGDRRWRFRGWLNGRNRTKNHELYRERRRQFFPKQRYHNLRVSLYYQFGPICKLLLNYLLVCKRKCCLRKDSLSSSC